MLIHEREFGKNLAEIFDSVRAFENRHQRGTEPEEIFAVAQGFLQDEIFLECGVHRRRLSYDRFQASAFDDGKFSGPVGAEALAVDADAGFIHFGARLQVVDDFGEHAVGGFAGLDGRLAGARRIHADVADAGVQDYAKIFGQIFLAAVEAADGNDHWHGTFGIFGEAQVADDFGAFEGYADDLEGRVHHFRVGQEGFERFGVGALFAGGSGDRPASKGVEAPGADEILVGLR